jgi:hypothetical protein
MLLAGDLLISGGCMQDRGTDSQRSNVASTVTDKSSQPASKTNAPDSGLGHIGSNGQNDAGGSLGGIH